jgi:DNA helicase-2/ATP-dependent DNA helicase PcrA
MQDYLNGLNQQQKEAVLHTHGPLMIIAGAGSGKTKVLTTRIANLMANGVDPFHILALTFTNKAAAEMKERIEKILGNNEARNLYIGTFHSVFARILRAEATKIGYPNNFTIYDTDDSRSVLKAIITEMNLDIKLYKPSIIHNRISAAKNELITADQYKLNLNWQKEDAKVQRPAFATIYSTYVARCFRNGAMDFDDLLLKMYELLNTNPQVLLKYQHKFKYVLIDEYQDTNPVQYKITKLLAAVNENICVVGDDAQSIYSFRGATIQNILQFEADYNDVKVIKLEQNYRSTKSILNVANNVISNNKEQLHKELWTENNIGEKIKLVKTPTDNEEGKFVADTIKENKLRNHFNNSDFAILYRTNAQSRAFEESLRKQGIAYKIYGGMSFFQYKEIKDMLAYLRLVINTNDDEALKRIINYPTRGIGKTTLERLAIIANEQNTPIFHIIQKAAEFGFKAGTLELLQNFATMIKYFQSVLTDKNAYDVAVLVGKHTGLVAELFNDKSNEGLGRYDNVQELLNSIKEWTESPDNEDGEIISKHLGAYLQHIILLTDADEEKGNDNDKVKLMTIHAAKGLEFECVFVAGVEESIFPNAMSINTREELEEERRLFYVAITRAKQKLWVTYASSRYKFGRLDNNEPSRFLNEMPEEFLDKSFSGAGLNNHFNSGSTYNKTNSNYNQFSYFANKKPVQEKKPSYLPVNPPSANVVTHIPSSNFIASDITTLQEGQKIEHQRFGYGYITKLEGSNHNPVAIIKFELNGEKKIMLNYAKIRIVE